MDFYEILQIDQNATDKDIKKAYRKLALIYHPDKPSGDEEKFKQINIAYEVLSNTQKKIKYDGLNAANRIKLFDLFNSIIPAKHSSTINLIIDFFYDNKNDLRNDLDSMDFTTIKNKILNKLSESSIVDILRSTYSWNAKKNIIIDDDDDIFTENNLDISGEITVTLDERYCKKYRKINVKRVRDNKLDSKQFDIPILDDIYILDCEGDKNNLCSGDLTITIKEKQHELFERVGQYDMMITKKITFYDYLYGFEFELELPDKIVLHIKNMNPKENGLITIYKNYGFYHDYDSVERGNLIIKYVIDNNKLDKEKVYEIFGSKFVLQ